MRGEMKSRYTAAQRVGTLVLCLILVALLSFLLLYEPRPGEHGSTDSTSLAIADSLLAADVARFSGGLRTYEPGEISRPHGYTSDHTADSAYGSEDKSPRSPAAFPFDPNTADSATLVSLGFRPFVARNIVRYRRAGGRFRRPADLLRIYGIDSARVTSLHSYITIADTTLTDSLRHRRKAALPEGYTVDLNSADTAELIRLPRIGSVRASQILRYRKRLGGYADIRQIAEACSGMDTAELRAASAHLRVCTDSIKRIPVNRSSVERLDRHPYISFYQAKSLYEYRWDKGGCIDSIGELLSLPEFSPADIRRLSPYLDFSCSKPQKNTRGHL